MYKSIYSRNVHSESEINKVKREVWRVSDKVTKQSKANAKVTLRGRYIYIYVYTYILQNYTDMTSLVTALTLPSAKRT